MWILLLLLLQASGPPPTPSPCSNQPSAQTSNRPPALIVQAVDPAWLPVGGARVTIRDENRKASVQTDTTESDGYAKFSLAPGEYSVEVKLTGFKTQRVQEVQIKSETAYVQLQMKLAGSFVTVY